MVAALRRSPLARDASSRRGRGSKNNNRLLLLLFSSCRRRTRARRALVRRVRSAKGDSNREPVGAAAARGGKTHDAHLMEMLRLWHLLI
ncbi:hypothetical protein EMIHUDRAFT_256592 [Emiliania huxleyi CCMP1516]|uniref:Uncharacterized protein n=2 Tax=Emiliania huxleyi TaxID=2903 RepID=A0A0D3ISN4_EMIH1|nr:hypothetical protein EMIHUDRAFT_256592 [Emiliania huxleyi CCMP1516]EOD14269.1 hypothetical protein EMIHUDRAFT_256592 [Emiliania huxleyi CCMP1516]|eukprot:XP_005766698.1 hypothetical protein EMIHUDRAFT_256592 [Emiliania huxleyi CCMP1516]